MSKKKADQSDRSTKEWTTTIVSYDLDGALEQARFQAADLFKEPLKNIQAISGNPSIHSYDPFPTDADMPAKVDKWQMSVTFRVKDKDDEQSGIAVD